MLNTDIYASIIKYTIFCLIDFSGGGTELLSLVRHCKFNCRMLNNLKLS